MSEDVTYMGRLELVPNPLNLDMEEIARLILVERGIKPYKLYESFLEQMEDELHREYIVRQNKVWKVIFKTPPEERDIFEIRKTSESTYEFVLKYYNGGCGFGEAMGWAFESLEKNIKKP